MIRVLCVALLVAFMSCSANAGLTSLGVAKTALPYIYYVTIPVETATGILQVNGQYRLPRDAGDTPIPAVVILHSTGGVDSTGAFYATALNEAGYATLELDMWSPRGFAGGSASRPGLPQETVPDAYAALKYLAELDEIDENRIGVMGFSWGGVITLLSATEHYNNLMNQTGYQFAAHAAQYPVCYLYNNPALPIPGFDFADIMAPVLIQSGTKDDYDTPTMCPSLVANLAPADRELVKVNMYPMAYHGWDRLEPAIQVADPFAHLGQGGMATLKPAPVMAHLSRMRVVKHFTKAFNH